MLKHCTNIVIQSFYYAPLKLLFLLKGILSKGWDLAGKQGTMKAASLETMYLQKIQGFDTKNYWIFTVVFQ